MATTLAIIDDDLADRFKSAVEKHHGGIAYGNIAKEVREALENHIRAMVTKK